MTIWQRAAVTAFLENKGAGKMSYILRRVDQVKHAKKVKDEAIINFNVNKNSKNHFVSSHSLY